ncbi:MAG: hypothetical protein R2712_09020 [Vicinamibacterales bacterium]
MPYSTYGLLKTIRRHTISVPRVAETVDHGRPNACNLCHVDKTLRWTSDALERWYGQPRAGLSPDQERVSSMVLMALAGDAGQRVIAAEAFRWRPAQQAGDCPPGWRRTSFSCWTIRRCRAVAHSGRGAFPGSRMWRWMSSRDRAPGVRRSSRRCVCGTHARTAAPASATECRAAGWQGGVRVDEMLRLIRQRNHRRMLLRE